MEFRILGPLEVRDGARELRCRGRKQRLLLAVLLLHANEVVSADTLVEAVWGEPPPERARGVLQVYVANLRKLLGSPDGGSTAPRRLARQAPGYLLPG